MKVPLDSTATVCDAIWKRNWTILDRNTENSRRNTKKPIKIWRADSNGRITQDESFNAIGIRTLARKLKRTWRNYTKTLENQQLCCRNTFCTPPKANKQNLATRHNYEGAQSKRIYLCAISTKIKNRVAKITNMCPENPHCITKRKW